MTEEIKYVVEKDCTTGEEIIREFTPEEYIDAAERAAAFEQQQLNVLAEQEAKLAAKASAESKLAALGLTEEEIKAIIG